MTAPIKTLTTTMLIWKAAELLSQEEGEAWLEPLPPTVTWEPWLADERGASSLLLAAVWARWSRVAAT